ncbi:MAG: tRNA (adenosine(37)-N6)-dimethylallyltransferase MiaA, partial [Gemmatimonadota bacterium]
GARPSAGSPSTSWSDASGGMADRGHAAAGKDALVLTGPTAAGKTRLALAVAERLGGEIISADSRQVYRSLDIGTAKATAVERARVPHHGLDLVDPGERYSAGRFARDARRWVGEIQARGRVPLIVGGTGFFLRALTAPLFREPPLDRDRRERLKTFLDGLPDGALARWLAVLDPESAERLAEQGGRQRVLRALEMALLTGRPLGWWHRHRAAEGEGLDVVTFVLSLPRDVLYDRINRRVDAMLDAGLVDEVAGLLERGYDPEDPGMTATGYPEIAAYLKGSGEPSLEAAADRIRRRTRGYARRQLTWFRNQLPEDTTWLDGTRPMEELVDEVVERWESH